MQERLVPCLPRTLAGIRPGVRPFVHQRPVEPLDLPVRLRTTRLRPLVPNAVPERSFEVPGPIAGPVVRHHRIHAHTDPGEERPGTSPEPGRGVLLLVGEDLGVDQPGVVINSVMQIPIPPRRRLPGTGSLAP